MKSQNFAFSTTFIKDNYFCMVLYSWYIKIDTQKFA